MNQVTTRNQIVNAADDLFYHQGYEHTSFTHIAKSVKISRGNFYYHFKTKDEILDAVIEHRMDATRSMLEQWEEETDDPKERIKSYIRIVLTNWDKIKHYGCPVGTLCSELTKLNHASRSDANAIFSIFRKWLGDNFVALGFVNEADALAMHVLAWSQGVATLASSYQDEKFARLEVRNICGWLDQLVGE